MFHTATTSYRDRRVSYAFNGPVIEQEDIYDGAEVWNERIKVTCSHNKDKKRYEAYVSWCKASTRGDFSIEQHAIFTDPNVLVVVEPAARFSEKTFGAFCERVQRECVEFAADEYNVSVAADLLRKAQGYAAVTN